ncbi:MAG: peptidyl-prolyl cis-trans isomerase [Hyphomicrobiales bacterium]
MTARGPLTLALAALAAAVIAGCGSTAPKPADGSAGASGAAATSPGAPRVWAPPVADTLGPTVAIVGSRRFRASEVDSLIASAPAQAQQQLRTRDGYKNLLERLTAEEAVYQAATQAGFAKDSTYQADLAKAARDLLVRQYYQRHVNAFPQPSDSAVAAFYEEHKSDFAVPARVRVRHIQLATRAKAEALRKRLTAGGLWDALCKANSTDAKTKNDGGIVGYVTPGTDLVPGIGKAPSIVAAAFALQEGEISQPLKTDKAWHLIRVDDLQPKHTPPLSDFSARIRSQLESQAQDAYSKAFLDSLEQARNTKIFDDSIDVALSPVKSPQDLFQAAQSATGPRDRIALYQDVVKRFPDDPISARASFMIGFTYAEDLQDYTAARAAFQEFLRRYPKSDLVDSATWMMQNMDKPAPELKDSPEGGGGTHAAPDSTR